MAKAAKKMIIPDEAIIDKILLIRDKKVMIDKDIASLYGVPTKRLNEQVKRNTKRFPDNFMFQRNLAQICRKGNVGSVSVPFLNYDGVEGHNFL